MARVLLVVGCLGLVLGGCSGGGAATTTLPGGASSTTLPAVTTSGATTGAPDTTTTVADDGGFVIVVAGTTVVVEGEPVTMGERVAVPLGAAVRLEVTLDTADEVHVHGYDLTLDATPGVAAVLEFAADIPGIFEVELESAHTLLLELEVS